MRRAKGASSLAAVIVEQALHDFAFAPKESAAYRTAKMFLTGGECVHTVCSDCTVPSAGWRSGECPPNAPGEPCHCGHPWERHSKIVFDWEEHRNLIAGAAGIDPEVLERCCFEPS